MLKLADVLVEFKKSLNYSVSSEVGHFVTDAADVGVDVDGIDLEMLGLLLDMSMVSQKGLHYHTDEMASLAITNLLNVLEKHKCFLTGYYEACATQSQILAELACAYIVATQLKTKDIQELLILDDLKFKFFEILKKVILATPIQEKNIAGELQNKMN
jgi:hypothetical protein